MSDPAPFYQPLGAGRFLASSSCGGPWDPRHQHGGPPAALLARAIEQCEPRERMQIARMTAEILGPVPVGEVVVSARLERPGRNVEMLTAQMSADGRTVMRASAWRVTRTPDDLSPVGVAPGHTEVVGERVSFTAVGWHDGYLSAIEWRLVDGSLAEPGPCTVWTRMRAPLVAGEPTSGLQRTLVVADAGNGLSSALDLREWWFINPELTVHVLREPVGEWVRVAAGTAIEPGGVGLARTSLSDIRGEFGAGAQALLVARRP